MTTLPLHTLPPLTMKRLTDRARAEQRKSRLRRWLDKQVMDDPRSIEEQMADEYSPDRSSVWFAIVILACVAFYVGATVAIIRFF